jgi:F420H(2)-dependent biliverdin reductase
VARPLVPASDAFRAFWTERHLATLVALRSDGRPHAVPVGVTLDVDAGIARVICSAGTQKARNAAERGVAAVSQVDGRRWSTLEGDAVVVTDRAAVADAEARYAARYRPPRENPRRVVIEITVRRVLGLL